MPAAATHATADTATATRPPNPGHDRAGPAATDGVGADIIAPVPPEDRRATLA